MTPAAPPPPGPPPPLAPPRGRVHEVVTPEGVPLQLQVAAAGDRVAALIVDLLLMAVVVVGIPLALAVSGLGIGSDLVRALLVLGWFLVWTFYFPVFELAWQGQTPGKRAMKIRAVDARGGPLTAEAVIARNLARQFELMLPLMAVFTLGASGWFDLAALGWMVVLGFLPLFHEDRLRVGDMIAGTIVIRVPAARLLEDLATRTPTAHAFTEAQLDVYGVYELQVLEDVLRGGGAGHAEAVRTVAEKIRAKIGWTDRGVQDELFLQAFYSALRDRLEKRLLFGKRRRSKHDRA